MKLLLILLLFSSCVTTKQFEPTSFKDDINASIIDGFYNNDTTNLSGTIYLIR